MTFSSEIYFEELGVPLDGVQRPSDFFTYLAYEE